MTQRQLYVDPSENPHIYSLLDLHWLERKYMIIRIIQMNTPSYSYGDYYSAC